MDLAAGRRPKGRSGGLFAGKRPPAQGLRASGIRPTRSWIPPVYKGTPICYLKVNSPGRRKGRRGPIQLRNAQDRRRAL